MAAFTATPIPIQANGLAADAQVTGDTTPVPNDGWIVLAGLPPLSGAGNARVRARIDLLGPPAGDGTRSVLGSLWQGYATAEGQPFSKPNQKVYAGWAVRLVAAAATGWTTGRVSGTVYIDDQPPSGGAFIFSQPVGPSAGPGDVGVEVLADPAAGADFANLTVPARTTYAVEGFAASLVTDATATVRTLRINYGTNDTTAVAAGSISFFMPASQTNVVRGHPGATVSISDGVTAVDQIPITVPGTAMLLPPAYVVSFATDNLQAGDNWGAGNLRVERWAVIL